MYRLKLEKQLSIRNTKIKLYLIFLFFSAILFLEPWLGVSGMSQVTLSHDHVP